jgi:hypothetical protein
MNLGERIERGNPQMSGKKEKTDPTLETILKGANAKRAYDKLVGLKMRPDVLEFWLHAIGEMSDGVPKTTNYDRPKIVKLVKKSRALANEIDRTFRSGKTPRIVNPAAMAQVLSISKELRIFANALEQSTPAPKNNPPGTSPRADAIIDFLMAVEYFTGSFHYGEAADLLNAVDVAYELASVEPVWDVTQLKQRRYRYLARLKKRYPGRPPD